MKKTVIIILAVVVGLFAVGIVKDQIIKSTVTVVASGILGAPVHIDGFSFKLVMHSIKISGLKVYNPAGFSRRILLDLGKVYADYDLGALLKGKLHLKQLDLQIKEIGLEKDKEGKMNVDSLKVAKKESSGKEEKPGKPAKQMPMQIDLLNLEMGRVVSKDYSVGAEPKVEVYNLGLKRSYKNIASANQLAALILTEPLKAAGIKGVQIYSVAALTGVAFLPAAAAVTLMGKDSATQEFSLPLEKLFDQSLQVLRRMGKVTKDDLKTGVIEAQVDSANVVLRFKKASSSKTGITASARKTLLPKPEIAAGVLYEIEEKVGR